MKNEANNELGKTARKLQDNNAIRKLLADEDTKRMVDLLGSREHVRDAAKAAAAGDPAQLMEMMQQLMGSAEGAQLMDRISKQARESGL